MVPLLFFISSEKYTGPDKPSAVRPGAADVQAELDRILSSPRFSRAPRACALLRFVVRQMLAGSAGRANEYAIGIEVFGRKASAYHPGEDPIVRVQVGRLRSKLADYYAHDGRNNPLRIDVPLGRYLPCVTPAQHLAPVAGFAFHPLACLSQDWVAQSFTHGLNDELSYRLHRAFGPRSHGGAWPERAPPPETAYLLEGSVRQGDRHMRTSLRLIDRSGGAIVWSQQFDHGGELPIARQEQFADACCEALRSYLGMPC